MKRLLLLFVPLAAVGAAPAADWSPNLTTFAAWQGNVGNGAAAWDRISTLQLGADVLASASYDVTRFDAAYVTAHCAGDWFPRFRALGRIAGGARLDWEHTFGSGESAPVFGLEGAIDAIDAMETARRGTATAITLRIGRKFAGAWRAMLRQRFDRQDAKDAVFDGGGGETALEIGRDIDESTRVTLAARLRNGDVVTYARYDRPDLAAIAHATADLKTFGEPVTAYATDARTVGGRIALVHALDDQAALVLAYEASRTRRTGLRFANQTVSLSFVHQY